MCTFLGAAVTLTVADVSPEPIASAEILYLEGYLFDPEEARAAFAKAAQIARGAGRRIALTLSDPFVVERHCEALREFIDTEVDVLFANEVEIMALFKTDDLDVALSGLRGRVAVAAVTRSALGAIIVDGSDLTRTAAEPVNQVVDTTGAGDQYAAGFLVGLAAGRPFRQCARLGAVAAAEVISHFGPRPQVRLRELTASVGL
jgi:sugar/nucleoside kinase (ribokinase family)